MGAVIASIDGAGAGKRRKVEKDSKAIVAPVVYLRPVHYEVDLRTAVAGPIKVGCVVCSSALIRALWVDEQGVSRNATIRDPRTKNMGV